MANVPISFGATGGLIFAPDFTTQSNGMAGATFNATSSGIDTATATIDGVTAATNITVIAPPTISIAFGAATVPLNGSTSLSFTINNNSSSALTGIGFADTLPAGLLVATPANLIGSCGGGTIQATAGSNAVTLSGAQLAVGTSCTFSVDVMGTTAGGKLNTTGNVNSIEGGSGLTASASISVVAPPAITKSFFFPNVGLNQTTGLKFIINNPFVNSVGQTGAAFTDALPAGMVVATPNALSNTCGGTVTATAGSSSVSLSGGSISINGSCTIIVNVTATTTGLKNNSVTVSSTNGGTGNTSMPVSQ